MNGHRSRSISRRSVGCPGSARAFDARSRTAVGDWLISGPLVVEQARQTDALVLALYGDLDLASSSLLDAVLENAELDAEEHVVIDLSGLEFMDAAGLRVLVAAQQRSLQNGHRLSLLRGRRTVQRIFELTQTTTALRFDD